MKASSVAGGFLAILAVVNSSWALAPGAFVPAFRNPSNSPLGLNAATVVHLAIWKTLRKAPYPNPSNLDFGDGIVIWSEKPLGEMTADSAAMWTGVPLVIDGSAFKYGSGAVVTTRLFITAPKDTDIAAQSWTIRFDLSKIGGQGKSGPRELKNDIFPERRVEFASIPLQGNDLKEFESAGLLEVHKGAPTGPVIGRVGDNFRAQKQLGNAALVTTSAGFEGYLVLPQPTTELTAMAAFTGGVIRILRSDWAGAVDLLKAAESNQATPTSLRIDSLLMGAFCLEKQGTSGIELVEGATKLSPSAPRLLKYRVMVIGSTLARLLDRNAPASALVFLPSFSAAVENLAAVSAKDDPWVADARSVVTLLNGLKGDSPQTHVRTLEGRQVQVTSANRPLNNPTAWVRH